MSHTQFMERVAQLGRAPADQLQAGLRQEAPEPPECLATLATAAKNYQTHRWDFDFVG